MLATVAQLEANGSETRLGDFSLRCRVQSADSPSAQRGARSLLLQRDGGQSRRSSPIPRLKRRFQGTQMELTFGSFKLP